MLATARALCIQPKFLLLDEPSEGLMPKYVERIFETVERLKKEKVGILLVEQKIDGVLKISDRVAFLENGNLEHQTTPEALAENDEPLYRFVGIKSRGVYETPGGTLLREAHVDLEGIALDKEVKRIQDTVLTPEFSRLCYNGFYFSPEMELIKNSINFAQKDVDGWVEMDLYKGNITVTGRGSDKTLYSAELASMDIEGGGEALDYNPADAAGFINCNATRLKAYGALRGNK